MSIKYFVLYPLNIVVSKYKSIAFIFYGSIYSGLPVYSFIITFLGIEEHGQIEMKMNDCIVASPKQSS